jgi:hypothetical protein
MLLNPTTEIKSNEVKFQKDWQLKDFEADDWLCALCLEKITSDKQRFFYQGKSEFQFTNPGGYNFHIITFSKTFSCVITTSPTLEYTWFPGYAWSICQCNSCNSHLGWQYVNKLTFYGLIREQLVQGLSMLN